MSHVWIECIGVLFLIIIVPNVANLISEDLYQPLHPRKKWASAVKNVALTAHRTSHEISFYKYTL